jgi:fucose 4-O-acetylase-like acetyltransferase
LRRYRIGARRAADTDVDRIEHGGIMNSLNPHATVAAAESGIRIEPAQMARGGEAATVESLSRAKRVRIRREDLDRAKGLGITLVVLGHIVARSPPPGDGWFEYIKSGVYQFHMPFFMYLSGYVAFLTGSARASPDTWLALFGKRAVRLLVPFLIVGLLIAGGKAALGSYLHIDNPADAGLADVVNLVWHTDRSVALSIWYMAVLFILSCLTPVFLWVLRGNSLALLGVAAVLYFLPIPPLAYLDRAATYFIFFVVGGLAAEAGERWLRAMDRTRAVSLIALLALVAGALVLYAQGELRYAGISLLVCGIVSMPALHGLVRTAPWSGSRVLLSLGAFSFVIYLLNTLCIGLAKGLLWKVAPWDGRNFLIYAPVLLAAGLLLPIAIKVWMLRRAPLLDRMTQ